MPTCGPRSLPFLELFHGLKEVNALALDFSLPRGFGSSSSQQCRFEDVFGPFIIT